MSTSLASELRYSRATINTCQTYTQVTVFFFQRPRGDFSNKSLAESEGSFCFHFLALVLPIPILNRFSLTFL